MTIDERLEALTQTVELMAHMQRDTERQTSEKLAQTSEQIRQLIAAVNTDAENIRALARVAEIHERRLTGLEA